MKSERLGRNFLILTIFLGLCAWESMGTVFADAIVISYCQKTKSFGIESDESEGKATEKSLRHCNASGGHKVEGCCRVVGIAEEGCIAIAVASDGEYGLEKGDTAAEAISAAVENCPTSGCIVKTSRCLKSD